MLALPGTWLVCLPFGGEEERSREEEEGREGRAVLPSVPTLALCRKEPLHMRCCHMFQLPSVGFATMVHISIVACCTSDLSVLVWSSVADELLNFVDC